MPPPRTTPARSATTRRDSGDGPLYAGLAVALLMGIGLPAAVAMGAGDALIGVSALEGDQPSWVPAQQVRGTTRNGDMVRMRVSLDAPDPRTREFVQTRRDQVALVLQNGLAEQDSAQAAGAERVRLLADGLQSHLNGYLEARELSPVRDVVIEDLVIGRAAPPASTR